MAFLGRLLNFFETLEQIAAIFQSLYGPAGVAIVVGLSNDWILAQMHWGVPSRIAILTAFLMVYSVLNPPEI